MKIPKSGNAGTRIFLILGFIGMMTPMGRSEEIVLAKAEFVGAQTCISCHEQRKDFDKSFHSNMLMKHKGIAFDKSCETCHGPGSLHAEAGGDRKNPNFAAIGGPKTNPKILTQACLQCHGDTHPYWESSTHARKGVSCNSCHAVHQDQTPGATQGKLIKKGTPTQACFQCHRDKKAHVARAAHMPVKEGKMTCASCHDPHGTPHEKQLKSASARELCLSCHAEKRGPFLWEHPPVRENCLACHDAHGSLHDKLLVAKRPYLLCQRCHIATRHPSTLYSADRLVTQDAHLFNRSCLNCHVNIHGSNHPSGNMFVR